MDYHHKGEIVAISCRAGIMMTMEYNETKLFGIMFFIWRTQEISEERGEKTVLRNQDFVTEREIRAFNSC